MSKRFTKAAWLLFNLRLGGLTFGFGSITPMYERALVQDTQALTREEFQETLTLAQVLPGPSLVSMTMYLGQRMFGTLVALLGVVCLCLPGALWAALVVRWVPFERPLVQRLMQGFAIGAAVLLADFIRRLCPGIAGTHVRGELATRAKLARRVAVALGVAVSIAARVPMITVVLAGIAVSVVAEFLPVILLQLFWLCFRTSLVSFGGVYGALPELQRLFVVKYAWLTSEQLIQSYVIGQLVPGPNMVVCTLIGLRVAGVPGALAASLGTYLAPILLISAAAKIFHRYYGVPWVRRLEIALRPMVIGFMSAAAIAILRTQLSEQALATVLVTALAVVLYVRRILGPMALMAASGVAFAVISFGLRLV